MGGSDAGTVVPLTPITHVPAPAAAGPPMALAQTLIGRSSDIALLVDRDGIVTSLAHNERAPEDAERWIGQPWVQSATPGTSNKVVRLLADASTSGPGRSRQVNHASENGHEVAMAYSASRTDVQGPVLVVGYNMRYNSALQVQLLQAQQSLERSYWQARQQALHEQQCRQVAEQAVLVVDLAGPHIVAHNASAARLLFKGQGGPTGRSVESVFDARSWPAVAAVLRRAARQEPLAEVHARLAGTHADVAVMTLPLGAPDQPRVLLQLRTADMAPLLAEPWKGPAAVLICNNAGLVCEANQAFRALAGVAAGAPLPERHLDDWLLARHGAPALLETVGRQGMVTTDKMRLHRQGGIALQVEISGTLLASGPAGRCGFMLRPLPALVSTSFPSAPR